MINLLVMQLRRYVIATYRKQHVNLHCKLRLWLTKLDRGGYPAAESKYQTKKMAQSMKNYEFITN